jgi:hypothetical protein
MQLSNAPAQIVEAWATGDSSKTNPIPVPSQIGITPGAASWTDGFPPLCDTPVSSGGIPPSKADMNGGLFQMSAVDVWMCAGGGFPYSSAFSASIGGYPKGARVLMASGGGYWISTVDNNTSDPDTAGAGWAAIDNNGITALTGDVTASGPGSAAATVNWPHPGTIGSATPNTGAFTTLTATTPASSDNSAKAATTAWCLLGFAVLLNVNGYIKLPSWLSGLMIQWGTTGVLANNTPVTCNYTTSFPTAALMVIPTDNGGRISSGNISAVGAVVTGSTSSFVVNVGDSGETVGWIAIGY